MEAEGPQPIPLSNLLYKIKCIYSTLWQTFAYILIETSMEETPQFSLVTSYNTFPLLLGSILRCRGQRNTLPTVAVESPASECSQWLDKQA